MKLRYLMLGILLLGAAGGFWLSRPAVPPRHIPGRLLSPESLKRVRLSGGSDHGLALAPDGSLWSWGDASPALGQGNITPSVKAPQRIGQDNDWAEIHAFFMHSLALKTDGSLWAWGFNSFGELGDGTQQPRDLPTRIGSDTNWLFASPGMYHKAGLKRDGTIWAWGVNSYGQLGSAEVAATTTNISFVPVRVGTWTNWTSLAVSALANAALQRDGSLWTWGDGNHTPQMAPGPAVNNFTPIQLGPATNWVAVASGYYHFLALQSDGSLWSWGRNGHMIGGIPAKDMSQPRRFGTETNWAAILDGAYGNFVQKKDGSWWQLGGPAGQAELVSIPGQWWQLAQGAGFSLAVDQDGSLWHWGVILGGRQRPHWISYELGRWLKKLNINNSLGQATTPSRAEPEPVFQLPGGQPAR